MGGKGRLVVGIILYSCACIFCRIYVNVFFKWLLLCEDRSRIPRSFSHSLSLLKTTPPPLPGSLVTSSPSRGSRHFFHYTSFHVCVCVPFHFLKSLLVFYLMKLSLLRIRKGNSIESTVGYLFDLFHDDDDDIYIYIYTCIYIYMMCMYRIYIYI